MMQRLVIMSVKADELDALESLAEKIVKGATRRAEKAAEAQTPTAAAPIPEPPTEAQIRARHKDSMARALATVERVLEEFENLSRPEIVERLYYAGFYDNASSQSHGNPLARHLQSEVSKAIPFPLSEPKVTVWGEYVSIQLGPFYTNVLVGPTVGTLIGTFSSLPAYRSDAR